MKLTSDQISDIPYVLFINDKGQGWTLNRQYKLQYHNIGDWDGLKRTVLKGLLPLAKKVEQGYPLTDREIPEWVHRGRVNNAGHEFKTYWFDQLDHQEAYYIPFINLGVTYHFDKAGNTRGIESSQSSTTGRNYRAVTVRNLVLRNHF